MRCLRQWLRAWHQSTAKTGQIYECYDHNGISAFIGGILLAAAGVLTGGTLTAVWQGVLLLLYMAALSAVAFTVWTYLLSHNPVSSVSIYNLLIPVFGTVLSGIFLQENIMTWTHLISIVLVCMGIVLVNRKQKAE